MKTPNSSLRLDCLKLAMQTQAAGDLRDVLEIAESYFLWVVGKADSNTLDIEFEIKNDQNGFNNVVSNDDQNRHTSIKNMILRILGDSSPNGMSSLDILIEINRKWKNNISRTSLSPQMSRLKNEGKIINKNGTYFIKRDDESKND